MMNAGGGVDAGAADCSAFGVFGARPNFFEVYLCEHLHGSLAPMASQLAKAALRCDPLWRLFFGGGGAATEAALQRWLLAHRRAAVAALAAAAEAVSLWRNDATLAERFLGLRRVSAAAASSVPPSALQRAVSVALAVLAPLAGKRIAKIAQQQRLLQQQQIEEEEEEEGTKSKKTRLAQMALSATPAVVAAMGVVSVAYSIAYIGNLTRFASPALHIAGLRLVTSSSASSSLQQQQQRGLIRRALSVVADALRLALPLAAFGYRSLEWWYSIPHSVLRGNESDSTVPPAPEAPALVEGVTVPADERCPLCGRERTNPAVLAASGFAFCYPCIVRYVREHGRCPVTGLPASESQIRRLFLR